MCAVSVQGAGCECATGRLCVQNECVRGVQWGAVCVQWVCNGRARNALGVHSEQGTGVQRSGRGAMGSLLGGVPMIWGPCGVGVPMGWGSLTPHGRPTAPLDGERGAAGGRLLHADPMEYEPHLLGGGGRWALGGLWGVGVLWGVGGPMGCVRLGGGSYGMCGALWMCVGLEGGPMGYVGLGGVLMGCVGSHGVCGVPWGDPRPQIPPQVT